MNDTYLTILITFWVSSFCSAKLFTVLFHLERAFPPENTINSICVVRFYSSDLGMIRNSVQPFSERSDWEERFWSGLNCVKSELVTYL